MEGRGWVEVDQLRVGDRLVQPDGSSVAVESVRDTGRRATVFNFEVEGAHDYYVRVGQYWVLVHNQCETGDTPTVAARATAEEDHIVLGLRAHGLEGTASKVGGRTLLDDPEWMSSLQKAIGDPSTKFTVSLDGMSGGSTYSQVMGAAQRGAGGTGGYTDWEMAQLFQSARLSEVTFVRAGLPVANPWASQ